MAHYSKNMTKAELDKLWDVIKLTEEKHNALWIGLYDEVNNGLIEVTCRTGNDNAVIEKTLKEHGFTKWEES